MKITVRYVGGTKYADVMVEDRNVTLHLGLLDLSERRQLSETLREAADELLPDGDEG